MALHKVRLPQHFRSLRSLSVHRIFALTTAATVLLVSGGLFAQMPSPSIDRAGQPFSYFAQPTDQIGVAGAPSATEVTPEGFLYTGYGELMFFLGSDWEPVSTNDGPRTRTLEDGYLPIEQYDVQRDGLVYHFTLFSASVYPGHEGPVANFVRVTVKNPLSEPRAAFLSAAVRFQSPQYVEGAIPDNRFNRPANPSKPGGYHQPGDTFHANWTYGFDGDAALRDGKVLYLFPQNPAPHLALTLYRRYNSRPDIQTRKMKIQQTTPADVASYSFVLAPGATRSLDFRMPLLPDTKNSSAITALEKASFDEAHKRVELHWQRAIDDGMQITVPEAKANDLFRACLVNDLLSLNHVGDDWIQTVNQTHYHSFYLRDSSDFVHMYDVTGYPQIASRVLAFYAKQQQPDGNFLSQKGEYDGWGQTLWIYGFHYRFTHDRAFAEQVYPSVLRAIDWYEKAVAADPLHLMPSTDVKDNEFIPGHLTGYNFLALDGLQGAIALARGLGKTADAERFQHDYDQLRSSFLAVLRQRAAANGGAIPPALDGDNGGTDWGNLLAVTPEPQLDPHDPMVTATLKSSQSRYEEGISVYSRATEGKFLHHYLTIKNTLTELARDDQQRAIEEFYSLMLHTSATNSGFEYAIRPWGSRDFEGNLAPHGWFAAEFRNLMRAMMVREEGDRTLHLLSAVSPDWIGAGKQIVVQHAPTMWGEVGFTLKTTSPGHARLEISDQFANKRPEKVLLHLPWFMRTTSVRSEGKSLRIENGAVELPPRARVVDIAWTRSANTPGLSFQSTVAAYEAAYRKHYENYLRTGVPFAQ